VYVPARYDRGKLEVEFLTVHSSKGMEADHVVLPRMTSETLGFPSQVADDPVLQLAMPGSDSYEYAEERRLFYVAMTRARSAVTLITLEGRISSFVTELVAEMGLDIRDANGSASKSEVCPQCRKGFLASKKGRWGEFFGCSTFPRCKFTRNVASTPRRTDYARSPRLR
jgi:DNA helicase-4